MDIHMNASLRNDYNNFRKKDKKPNEGFLNMGGMGGIGVGFGVPQRLNQIPPQFVGNNSPPFGFNPQMGLGLNPMMTKIPPPPPTNFRQLWYLSIKL